MPLIFAPDADPAQPGVITSGTGLRPTTNGYANYKTIVSASANWLVPSVPRTMYGHNFGSTGRLIVGTANALFELKGNFAGGDTITDVSRAGGYSALGSGSSDEGTPTYWDMTSVGQYVLATNKVEPRIQSQASGA